MKTLSDTLKEVADELEKAGCKKGHKKKKKKVKSAGMTPEKAQKEFVDFLKSIQKAIPGAIKSIQKDNIDMNTAGLAHKMANVLDEDWYQYYFK